MNEKAETSITALVVVSVLIPLIGLIACPILLATGRRGGVSVLIAALLGFVVWGLIAG